MSIEVKAIIKCDGPSLEPHHSCGKYRVVTGTVVQGRALLKAQGWARRHHLDTQVDLCPNCKAFVTVSPTNKGGRPAIR